MSQKQYVPKNYKSFREWIFAQGKERQMETAEAIGVNHNYLIVYMAARNPIKRFNPTRKTIIKIIEASNGFLSLDSLIFYFFYEPILTILEENAGISVSWQNMHQQSKIELSNYELERLKNG